MEPMNAERARLTGEPHEVARWRAWGPYLADRAWATVREDYSPNGDPWHFFPHDDARRRPFRWGDDGIGGFCDRYQILCWSLALWNERDPILKERYFGLVPTEGNHGEDVKEYWFYVDALPSHAYQRMIYKYPQAEYPYVRLIEENRKRGLNDPEFELIDTGIFDESRYFDVEIEIAKETADSLAFRVTAYNRGPDRAPIHLVPQIWFRDTWSWRGDPHPKKPLIRIEDGNLLADDSTAEPLAGLLHQTHLGPHVFEVPEGARLLFTENEPHAKDAFHRHIIHGEPLTAREGTKAAAWMEFEVEPGQSATITMRLRPQTEDRGPRTEDVFAQRRQEADEFYAAIHPPKASDEERRIQRQAFAGMIWNKQIYLYDVDVWLDGDDPRRPPPPQREDGRNHRWRHLNSMRILSMPDKWEYPWFAAWDLAFQAVVFALIDAHFAKEQLWLLLFEQFQHPNGQLPAYEWEFSDLNPPVQAWAVWRVYNMDRIRNGTGDREFLERCFHKLLLNFTWWVNKVDREGNNVFEGGFLGLDNITLFDRSEVPGGAVLEQSDATGWMGMFSLVMMRIALELAKTDPVYEGLATKFFEHYVYIGAAMKMIRGDRTLWNEEDGFFYDILRFPDGTSIPFRVRSLVGLIPMYAVERLEKQWIEPFPVFHENMNWFIKHRKDIVERCVTTVYEPNGDFTHVLAVVDQNQLQHILMRIVDPNEFRSPYGMRSLSKFHEKNPFVFGGASVTYEPAESRESLKGGNSNWRGPVWFPTTFLMIESLRKLERGFGGTVRVTVPDDDNAADPPSTMTDTRATEGIAAGADVRARGMTIGPKTPPAPMTVSLSGVAARLADRLIRIFVPNAAGYRPVNGQPGTRKAELFAHDPYWKDLILFYEFFNGDTGEGLGASHQTGWTGLIANVIDEWRV